MSDYIRDFIYRGAQQPGLPLASFAPAAARFDVYCAVHKGVRESLQSALSALGSTEPMAGAALRGILSRAEIALDLAAAVYTLEERHIHPVLNSLSAELTRHACADHADGDVAVRLLRVRLRALHAQPDGTDLAAGLRVLEQGFDAYCADVACHMQRERRAHNPLLWLHETDAALRRLQATLLDDVPPHLHCSLAAWMARAARPGERAALLDTMRRRVPAEAYDMLLDQVGTPQGVAAAALPHAA